MRIVDEFISQHETSEFPSNKESSVEVFVIFFFAFESGAVDPSCSGGTIPHNQKTVFGLESSIYDVDPRANESSEKLEEIDVSPTEEVVGEFDEPVGAPRIPAAQAMFRRVDEIAHLREAKGKKIQTNPLVSNCEDFKS